MLLVERRQQIELPALLFGRNHLLVDVLDQSVDVGVLGIDVGALVHARQESRLPVLRFLDRVTAGTHGDESGQVLVLRAQAVGDPRSHAGANQPRLAAVHQQQRGFVVGHVGMHRADDADVVDVFGRASKQFAHLDAALPMLLKLVGRGERGARLSLGGQIEGQLLSVPLGQFWLGVERVDVRRPSVHEQVDDAFRLGGIVGRLRRQRIERRGVGLRFEQTVAAEQLHQAQRAEAQPAAPQQLATRDDVLSFATSRHTKTHSKSGPHAHIAARASGVDPPADVVCRLSFP